MPIYGTELDNEVVALFEELFIEHKIVPVLIDDIAIGGVVINCSTERINSNLRIADYYPTVKLDPTKMYRKVADNNPYQHV